MQNTIENIDENIFGERKHADRVDWEQWIIVKNKNAQGICNVLSCIQLWDMREQVKFNEGKDIWE